MIDEKLFRIEYAYFFNFNAPETNKKVKGKGKVFSSTGLGGP
jgi:hypothetical protein